MQKALIYCRVSSERQVREGSGLQSQRHLCQEYAKAHHFFVEKVFEEKGITGGNDFRKRPAMVALLQYLDDHPETNFVVIFDDLKRFARDTWFHMQLRQELNKRGAEPRCPTFNFEDTPENEFIEIVLAAQGSLERQQNARQVHHKMRARLQAGFWVFQAPLGYEYRKEKYQGSILVPSKSSKVVATALKKFAAGCFASQGDIIQYFRENGIKRAKSAVSNMLRNVLYAGHLEFPDWGIPLIKAVHEPLISLKIFQAIQNRLDRPNFRSRATDDMEFPLRRKIVCAHCGRKMTGSYFHGRSDFYGRYTCHNAACPAKPKYVPKEKVEKSYAALIGSFTLPEDMIQVIKIKAKAEWEKQTRSKRMMEASVGKEIAEAEQLIESLIHRVAHSDNPLLIRRYEDQIGKLEMDIALLKDERSQVRAGDFSGCWTPMEKFLRTAGEFWEKADLNTKNGLHTLLFDGHPPYSEKDGFRTAAFSHRARVFRQFCRDEFSMVEGSGLEFEPVMEFILGFGGISVKK